MAKKEKEIEIDTSDVVNHLKIIGDYAVLDEVAKRKIAADSARKMGMKISARELQKAADALRFTHGFITAKDTQEWLKAKGITIEEFKQHLETSLLVSKYKDFLEKKTSKTKYLSSPAVKETVRNLIFDDWVSKQLK